MKVEGKYRLIVSEAFGLGRWHIRVVLEKEGKMRRGNVRGMGYVLWIIP